MSLSTRTWYRCRFEPRVVSLDGVLAGPSALASQGGRRCSRKAGAVILEKLSAPSLIVLHLPPHSTVIVVLEGGAVVIVFTETAQTSCRRSVGAGVSRWASL